MSHPLAQLRAESQRLLENAFNNVYPGDLLPQVQYSMPPKIEMGELSSPVCFLIARRTKEDPSKIARILVENIDTGSSKLIDRVEAVNGYINFHVDVGNYSKIVLENAINQDEEYGFLKTDIPERVMIEHTSANPNGPIHIGNARNSIIGSCLSNLLEKRGHEVIIHYLVNDMGRQVAMATYGWRLLGKPKPEGFAELWVGTIYASVNVINEINKHKADLREAEENGWVYEAQEAQDNLEELEIAAKDLKARYENIFDILVEKLSKIKDPQSEIAGLNTAYENNELATVEDVRTVIEYCLKGFEKSLGEIGIGFDSFDYESQLVWDKAAEGVLEDLIKSGYVIRDKEAQILDCDWVARDLGLKERWRLHPKHEIPRLVLVRSDGTTLYTLRDIAYSIWKFSLVERVINVIGQEQTLAQLQLRIALAAIDKLSMGDRQLHYSYELVKLPGVKMSGRLGRYVTLIEVIERAIKLAYNEVEKRTPLLPEKEKRDIAKKVGYGAVKYTLLSVDPMKQVIFDWNQALNFDTNSAPFIQYSFARTCNILKKANGKPTPDYTQLKSSKEKDLINLLAQFPETFKSAAEELKPGDIIAYANNLADKFNSFYATQRVLNAESRGLIGSRLALVDATRITLRNALKILGIEAPERM
jgi:arginyl-tRNA synthetase